MEPFQEQDGAHQHQINRDGWHCERHLACRLLVIVDGYDETLPKDPPVDSSGVQHGWALELHGQESWQGPAASPKTPSPVSSAAPSFGSVRAGLECLPPAEAAGSAWQSTGLR